MRSSASFVWRISNSTLGKVVRLIDSFRLNDNRRFVPLIGYSFTKRISVLDLLVENAIRESAAFAIENAQDALIFFEREDFWNYLKRECFLAENELIEKQGKKVFFEFGVWSGRSINYFSTDFPEVSFVGFDTFTGLTESWGGTNLGKSAFSLNGKLPKVNKNVELVVGDVSDTLSVYLNTNKDLVDLSLVHFDMDTYSPTKLCLDTIRNFYNKEKKTLHGLVLVFDEFFGYPGFKLHEYKAFLEFLEEAQVKAEYIAFTNTCMAIRLVSRNIRNSFGEIELV